MEDKEDSRCSFNSVLKLGSRPNSGDMRGQTPPAYLEPIGAPPSPTKKKKKKKKKQQEELPPPQAHGWGARPPGAAPPSTHAAQPPPLQGNFLVENLIGTKSWHD